MVGMNQLISILPVVVRRTSRLGLVTSQSVLSLGPDVVWWSRRR